MAYRDQQGIEQSWSPARPDRDLSAALSLTIESITLIANIFPILVVFRVKKSSERTVTDILIGALAFTEILAVLAPLPVSLPSFIAQDEWKRGPAACHYYQFCVFWLLNVSSLLVIAMSMERVFALAMPMRYKSWSERHRVYFTIAGIYLATFLVSCLPFFGLAPPVMSSSGSPFCKSWISASSDVWYRSIFPMVLIVEGWTTMLLVLVLNTFLVFYLVRFGRRLQSPIIRHLKGRRPSEYSRCVTRSPSITAYVSRGLNSPKSSFNNKRGHQYTRTLNKNGDFKSPQNTATCSDINRILEERRSFYEFSKLVVVVAVLFYCTWLPVLVVMTLTQTGFLVSELVALYALLSTSITGLANPFIYLTLSRQYRRGYISIVTGGLKFCCPVRLCKKYLFHGVCQNKEISPSNETRHSNDIRITVTPASPNELIVKVTVI